MSIEDLALNSVLSVSFAWLTLLVLWVQAKSASVRRELAPVKSVVRKSYRRTE